MKYRESEEMYLETILLLKKKKACVHSVDIANELEYSRPSVSRAVGLLQKSGYITMAQSGEIELTDVGYRKAMDIYERHRLITEALIVMGAEETVAEENACRIEHVISEELMETLKKFLHKTKE
ncbi:MAG: metal-dependent transcriptional regulator [Clostridia bacterium]|nr:metal-dependent transcriptional regulator [Clostridia bacterium]